MLASYSDYLMTRTILLASSSPQRQRILEQIGLPFEVRPSTFPEDLDKDSFHSPVDFVRETAKQKALNVAKSIKEEFALSFVSPPKIEGRDDGVERVVADCDPKLKLLPHLIIAADTVVVLDGEIIGKPKNQMDNINILEVVKKVNNLTMLNGQRHTVFTGIALVLYDKQIRHPEKYDVKIMHDATEVRMAKLTSEMIEAYVNSGEPVNKAGGYAIQGMGSTFIERIDGDYFNVVGLPAYKLAEEIYMMCKNRML
ncbi:hypothetical protein CDAR_529291 [Caerostris darwini]|uniref:Maf-like protein n=1 Tax=Caerostris darwini TaxID=1538125 RepID=A0AAV4TVK5_9ARAC|nr:hypothetical protein CDAR_529291 [Caerostris darwini]